MGANAQTSVPLFAAGEVLTAVNQNLSAGTGVPVFATTATRDAAFGGTGEKTLAEGQMCYIEAAPKRLQVYNGTAFVDFDAEFTAFTPTFTNYTRGNGTTDSRYVRIGKLVFLYISESLGSTSSMGSGPSFTLPVTARAVAAITGNAYLLNPGDAYYPVLIAPSSTTTVFFDALNAAGTFAKGQSINSTVPFTWGNTDQIVIGLTYEAA